MQLYQFHQIKTIERYLTKTPELPVSIELLKLTKLMTHTDKASFIGAFELWSERWADFMKERAVEPRTGKRYYLHKRLRSACLSLWRNMPCLWTWDDYIEEGYSSPQD